MSSPFDKVRRSLPAKVSLMAGLTLLVGFSTWSYLAIQNQRDNIMSHIIQDADRLGSTIKLGAHYAMMTNSRGDIAQIIQNISTHKDIKNIRIYNKEGRIKYSSRSEEREKQTNIKDEACFVCHKTDPPQASLEVERRTRFIPSNEGYRMLGILSPIYNEPACSTDPCHVHPGDKKVLGALDVVVSLEEADKKINQITRWSVSATVIVLIMTLAAIVATMLRFIRRPMNTLIRGTELIGRGGPFTPVQVDQEDEMGLLARAINKMGQEIDEKQTELKKQRDEYQTLFEKVPCFITVQDRDFRLATYNRSFAETFKPDPGDFCFMAYKGRMEKCPDCPVEKTFLDGESHTSEECGYVKDGGLKTWIVTTSPIRNDYGDIVAAMEMCLDISARKSLEEELEKSEKKYYAIFNNIPNAVFVVDVDTHLILDCNESVKAVYGYTKPEIIGRPFPDLFLADEREQYEPRLNSSTIINQVRHKTQDGRVIYVTIRISPSEYPGQKVLLITTSDITQRLEAEQQLIQASKMATLGEMATGVAHELNQPLSVIKTASSFFMRKISRKETIREEILFSLAEEINSHVDRAVRIINHMREFGRKSDMQLEKIQVNDVLKRAFDIFGQQLKLREIEVIWDLDPDLPRIKAEPGRLEQVFVNLLLNARDAIEDRFETIGPEARPAKRIALTTLFNGRTVQIQVADNGTGISKPIQQKIFEPFFTTKKVGKGTGLGLSISYGLIQDFGGVISAANNQDGGATFTILFPLPEEG